MKTINIASRFTRIRSISLFLFGLLFFLSQSLNAGKAIDRTLFITQPDQSILSVRLLGDEHFHYATTIDGYFVVENEEQTYLYADFIGYTLVPDTVVAHDPADRTPTEEKYLSRKSKELPFYIVREANRRKLKARATSFSAPLLPSIGSYRIPVILIEFPDKVFQEQSTAQLLEARLNQNGYAHNNATGSVRDYFLQNSQERLNLTFDVFGPVRVSRTEQYYASNEDQQVYEMIEEACQLIEEQYGVHWPDYDYNQDGLVDNVSVIYAGGDRAQGAGRSAIWSHSGFTRLEGGSATIASYCCTAELFMRTRSLDGIGTFCHEFGHLLGLPDFYNTLVGESVNGRYMLMDSGNYNNSNRTPPFLTAIERSLLGWLDPEVLSSSYSLETLSPIAFNQAFRINTEEPNEYFLLENRSPEAWDDSPEMAQLGYGLLIYHIDRTPSALPQWSVFLQQYEEANTLNSNPAHYNCYLKKATEQQTPFKEDTQDRFTHDTYPYARSWQEKAIASPITQIRYGHNLITFTVNEQMTHFDRTLSKTEPICILNNRELWIDQLNGEKARIGIYTLQGRLISQLETSDTSIAIPIDPEHKAVIVQLTTSQGIYSFKQICTK